MDPKRQMIESKKKVFYFLWKSNLKYEQKKRSALVVLRIKARKKLFLFGPPSVFYVMS